MSFRILPYKQGSRSSKALAEQLGGLVLRLQLSKYRQKPHHRLINWGNSNPPFECRFNGNAAALLEVSNKLEFFRSFEGAVIPEYWENSDDIPDDAFPVVCRKLLTGHSGAGIHIAASRGDLQAAPLYVRYIKKKEEYRVHCGRYSDRIEVISLQRKARRLDHPNPNWEVRNHSNGFVYVRNDVNPPPCVTEAALAVFGQTGLDFGAVDVIYNAYHDRAYVLEINTAPGLEGQTVLDYANYFRSAA